MSDKTDIAALREICETLNEYGYDQDWEGGGVHADNADNAAKTIRMIIEQHCESSKILEAERQQREAAEKEATYWCNLNARKNEVIDQRNGECDRLIRENEALLARLAPKDITPFAYAYHYAGCETASGFEDWRNELSRERPPEWMLETGKVTGLIELFTAQQLPVAPEGWQMVPIQPTEHMVVSGFESVPDTFFSKKEEWQEYEAMSGCQQAAHRARLCWAAMLDAAPKADTQN